MASLRDKAIMLTYDDALVAWLVHKSFSRTYGARNLRRTIQKELEDPISEAIIDSFENPISAIEVYVADEKICVTAQ